MRQLLWMMVLADRVGVAVGVVRIQLYSGPCGGGAGAARGEAGLYDRVHRHTLICFETPWTAVLCDYDGTRTPCCYRRLSTLLYVLWRRRTAAASENTRHQSRFLFLCTLILLCTSRPLPPCGDRSSWQDAEELVDEMFADNVPRDEYTYCAAMNASLCFPVKRRVRRGRNSTAMRPPFPLGFAWLLLSKACHKVSLRVRRQPVVPRLVQHIL